MAEQHPRASGRARPADRRPRRRSCPGCSCTPSAGWASSAAADPGALDGRPRLLLGAAVRAAAVDAGVLLRCCGSRASGSTRRSPPGSVARRAAKEDLRTRLSGPRVSRSAAERQPGAEQDAGRERQPARCPAARAISAGPRPPESTVRAGGTASGAASSPSSAHGRADADGGDDGERDDEQPDEERSGCARSPSRTARVRLPTAASPSMSRRLLTTRIATISSPTGTDDRERQARRACRSARTSSRRPRPGRRTRRRRPRRAPGSRRAAARRCRSRRRRCRPRRRRPATSSTAPPAPRPGDARRRANASAGGDQHLPRGRRARADQPHRADPVGVGAAACRRSSRWRS